jgi:hypothetical protein
MTGGTYFDVLISYIYIYITAVSKTEPISAADLICPRVQVCWEINRTAGSTLRGHLLVFLAEVKADSYQR